MGKYSLKILSILLMSLVFLSCKQTEETEEVTAEITAAQMEGRKAAAAIITPQWDDTLQLQKALLEAKAKQSKYLIDHKPKSAKAFDYGFISTVRAVNPELAEKIAPEETENK